MNPEEITDFMLRRKQFTSKSSLYEAVCKHIDYGTITVLRDRKGISAVLRFDMVGECCKVLDLVVREDLERRGLIKQITVATWQRFPYARFFSFQRKTKYPYRDKPHAYKINRMFHFANKEN